jgi:hypothetical protein
MNQEQHINSGKEKTRRVAVGWNNSSKSFFACFFEGTTDEVLSRLRIGVYFGTVNRLDDLGVLLSRCGKIPDSSLEGLKIACADMPLPADLYWLVP